MAGGDKAYRVPRFPGIFEFDGGVSVAHSMAEQLKSAFVLKNQSVRISACSYTYRIKRHF